MLATVALSLILVHQAVLVTQSFPNFSGKWVAIPGRAEPSYLPAVGRVTITQNANTFAVQIGTGPVRRYRLGR